MSHGAETERLDLTSEMILRITRILQIWPRKSKMILDTRRIQIHMTSFFERIKGHCYIGNPETMMY